MPPLRCLPLRARLPLVSCLPLVGCITLLGCLALIATPGRAAPDTTMSMAEGERMVQSYLAMWSTDAGVNPASVDRFYAPRVVYYGKAFSRREVLGDKLAYIKQWPHRLYREVPGSLKGSCNADHSVCKVNFEMTWRRTNRDHDVATGRARMSFDFVPVEGTSKIARESARRL